MFNAVPSTAGSSAAIRNGTPAPSPQARNAPARTTTATTPIVQRRDVAAGAGVIAGFYRNRSSSPSDDDEGTGRSDLIHRRAAGERDNQ